MSQNNIYKILKQDIPYKSKGFLKDLTYLSLAQGLLYAGIEAEKAKDNNGAILKNVNYRLNKRITQRAETLRNNILNILKKNKIYYDKITNYKNLLFAEIVKTDKPLQLEILGLYIIFCRFYERDKPLDDEFKPILNKENQIFTLIDLLDETEAEKAHKDMFYFADKLCTLL